MTKRVSIIGGSGFVGRAIVRQATQAGYKVTVACRHPERARALLVEGVRLVKADITTGVGLDEAVSGADVVINLVGLLFERGHQTFAAAHTEGASNILSACERAGVSRYLHMSALGADAGSPSSYARTKAAAEGTVRSSSFEWTIFRPSVIYGAGDSFFNKFKKLSALGPVLPVIAGETKFQPVWVEDVARAFVMAMDNRHTVGQVYELAGPQAYTFKELLAMLMDVLGRKRLLLPVPAFAAKIMAVFMSILPTPLLTLDQLKLLAHDNVVDGDESYPAIFGEAARVEAVLPGFIEGPATRLQKMLDDSRTRYRQSQ